VQRQTGWNNLVLRNAAMVFAGACILCRVLPQARTTGRFHGLWALDFLLIAWIALYVLSSDHDEQQAEFRARRGLCNPAKISPVWTVIRLGWMCIVCANGFLLAGLPGDAAVWMFFGQALGFWLANVFEACDPLPPCRGKVREWLEAVKMKPVVAGSAAGG